MLNSMNARDKCELHCGQATAASRSSWIDLVAPAGENVQLARPGRATNRGRRHGEAEALGQGVQPQPRNRLAPQRDRFRRGEPSGVASRQASRRPKPPLARWGAKPRPPREARLPLAGPRAARVGPEGAEGTASSRAAQPKTTGSGATVRRSPSQGEPRFARRAPRAAQPPAGGRRP